jgi:hypothetical protein
MAEPFPSFAVRVTPTVPALAPIKVLKLRTSATTGRRSERVSRAVASAAVVGEPSRVTTAATRPHQGEVEAAASRAFVPHDPHQGCRQARSGSRPTRDRGAAGAPVDGDSASGRGRSGLALEQTSEVLEMREDSCVMSQCPANDVEASMSHVCRPRLMSPFRTRSRGCAVPPRLLPILTRPKPSRCCGRNFVTTVSRATML